MKSKDSIEKAMDKIFSIFQEQNTDKITIQRQYLPEIFSSNLLEISKNDGLPIIKQFVLQSFRIKGVKIIVYDNDVQFIDERKKKKESLKMINPHQIMKTAQTLVKHTLQKSEERKVIAPLSETKEVELEKDEK